MPVLFLGDFFVSQPIKCEIPLDTFILNLEAPITGKGQPAKNKINLCFNSDFDFIKFIGRNPLAVNLANNHILDFGTEGLLETIRFLEEKKIHFFGAGKEKDNYNNPYLFKYKNNTIAMLGYVSSETNPISGDPKIADCALFSGERVKNDIQSCRGRADIIVVNLHWGDEEIPFPRPDAVSVAHKIVDWGGHLVVGHHAHVIQSVEHYKNGHIYYGLGNFAFSDLDVPYMFDGVRYNGRYIKKLDKSNKYSIVVALEYDGGITHATTYFNGESVVFKKKPIPSWIPETFLLYNFAKWFQLRKRMLYRFLKSPKRINRSHVKYFIRGK